MNFLGLILKKDSTYKVHTIEDTKVRYTLMTHNTETDFLVDNSTDFFFISVVPKEKRKYISREHF